jgi:hypothetical protein
MYIGTLFMLTKYRKVIKVIQVQVTIIFLKLFYANFHAPGPQSSIRYV